MNPNESINGFQSRHIVYFDIVSISGRKNVYNYIITLYCVDLCVLENIDLELSFKFKKCTNINSDDWTIFVMIFVENDTKYLIRRIYIIIIYTFKEDFFELGYISQEIIYYLPGIEISPKIVCILLYIMPK